MMAEEKLELLPELLALVDSPEVLHTESEPKVAGGSRPKEEIPEDFGSSSG